EKPEIQPAGAISKKAIERKSVQLVDQLVEEEEVIESEIFTIVEENPQYPGGDEALHKFLKENLIYPASARESAIQGTVYLSFVVGNDGIINDIKVLRGIGGGCDEEAVRVVKQMPRWIPGRQRGKPVRVQYILPVKFTLAE
ncbi:MAG TPA: energy transducer TonB, partial [Lentimicrobium sp.]|nr:energy transducer TonB [Lentimicrobium sp.]